MYRNVSEITGKTFSKLPLTYGILVYDDHNSHKVPFCYLPLIITDSLFPSLIVRTEISGNVCG